MKSFVSILFFILFVSFSEASKEEKDLENLRAIPLGQAFMERNAPNFKKEVEKLLDGTTTDFFKAINSMTEQDEDIFKLTGAAWAEKIPQGKNIEEGKVYFPSEEMENPEIFFHVVDLLYALFPPLEKKDEYGRTALEVAEVWNNQAVYDTLLRYGQMVSEYSLYKFRGDRIWDQIPKIKLEETALIQAILEEDFVGFHKALEALYSGPAKDFFAVMHSRTEAEETVFHLLAKVQSHQKPFASGAGQMIRFVLPLTVKHHIDRTSNEQTQQAEENSNLLFDFTFSGILAYQTLPFSIELFTDGYYIAGVTMAVLAVEGLRGCYFAYKGRSRKKTKGK